MVLRRIAKNLRLVAIILLQDASPICEELLCDTLESMQREGLMAQMLVPMPSPQKRC